MLHYAERMRKFGPLKHLWAMRCESVHCKLKETDLTCKKNILKTVAFKEHIRMCQNCKDLEVEICFEYELGDVIVTTDDDDIAIYLIKSIVVTEAKKELQVQILQNIGFNDHFDAIAVLETNIFKKILYLEGHNTCKLYKNINNDLFVY